MKNLVTMLLASLLGIVFGCGDDHRTGGPCTYNVIPGTAHVLSAGPDPRSVEYDCRKYPGQIHFAFEPADPGARARYRYPRYSDDSHYRFIGYRVDSTWWKQHGSMLGHEMYCERHELTDGSCTPVIFEFPRVDRDEAWEKCR